VALVRTDVSEEPGAPSFLHSHRRENLKSYNLYIVTGGAYSDNGVRNSYIEEQQMPRNSEKEAQEATVTDD
jgi:hypothetical protein